MTPRRLYAADHYASERKRRADKLQLSIAAAVASGDGKLVRRLYDELDQD